jgi:hypothetical protein
MEHAPALVLAVVLILLVLIVGCAIRCRMRSRGAAGPDAVRVVTVVTYADDRFKRKNGGYKRTQARIAPVLARHPEIKRVIELNENDLFKSDLYKTHKAVYDQHFFAGAGYSFKPFFIKQALQEITDGEYILWHDCSPEIWPQENIDYNGMSLRPLMDLCDKNSGILMPAWTDRRHTHRRFTQPKCLELMGLNHLQHNRQGSASWVLVRKNAFSLRLVDEWLSYILQPDCAETHTEVDIRKDIPEFVQNRHDQSVLSLLFLKYGLKTSNECRHKIFNQKNVFCELASMPPPGS